MTEKDEKIIFLKFNSNKEKSKLAYQIETVINYLCKRYEYEYYKVQVGMVGDDFLKEISRIKITLKNK